MMQPREWPGLDEVIKLAQTEDWSWNADEER